MECKKYKTYNYSPDTSMVHDIRSKEAQVVPTVNLDQTGIQLHGSLNYSRNSILPTM